MYISNHIIPISCANPILRKRFVQLGSIQARLWTVDLPAPSNADLLAKRVAPPIPSREVSPAGADSARLGSRPAIWVNLATDPATVISAGNKDAEPVWRIAGRSGRRPSVTSRPGVKMWLQIVSPSPFAPRTRSLDPCGRAMPAEAGAAIDWAQVLLHPNSREQERKTSQKLSRPGRCVNLDFTLRTQCTFALHYKAVQPH